MNGRIRAVCTGARKGVPKSPSKGARFLAGKGIEGDAHAGDWHRQISIVDQADFDGMSRVVPDLTHGAFAENLVIEGLDLASAGLGTIVRLGSSARIRISQIGKACHNPCRIAKTAGTCIIPLRGLFARVVGDGDVAPGDAAAIEDMVPRSRLQAAVVTVSDRCHRGETEDTAGPAVARLLGERIGAHVYDVAIVPDDPEAISGKVCHYCDGHSIDLVVTVGGTGMSPRDVTPEATRAVLERLTPGIDEAMRAASLSRTPHAFLSRGVSGIRSETLVVSVPGSLSGAVENLEVVLPALPHAIEKLKGSKADCGRPPA